MTGKSISMCPLFDLALNKKVALSGMVSLIWPPTVVMSYRPFSRIGPENSTAPLVLFALIRCASISLKVISRLVVWASRLPVFSSTLIRPLTDFTSASPCDDRTSTSPLTLFARMSWPISRKRTRPLTELAVTAPFKFETEIWPLTDWI